MPSNILPDVKNSIVIRGAKVNREFPPAGLERVSRLAAVPGGPCNCNRLPDMVFFAAEENASWMRKS